MTLDTGLASWTRHTLGRGFRRLRRLAPSGGDASRAARAVGWVARHTLAEGGVRVHSRHVAAYPEVTGYLVPTLIARGERTLARRLVEWLVGIQDAGGGYLGPDGAPFDFDTGQVLRGLLAGRELVPAAAAAARRAAEHLCARMLDGGAGGFAPRYAGTIPETIHLYVLPPLVDAADAFDEPRYRDAAARCLAHYLASPALLRLDDLTHFLAYEIEALIELGRADRVVPALDALAAVQRADGAVRAAGGTAWVCTPGLAQLAGCWYRIGRAAPADRALAWLESHQEPSGGFLGSDGPGAGYFADVEPAWAVKYFLDADARRLAAWVERAPAAPAAADVRITAVRALAAPGGEVLAVGAPTERLLAAAGVRPAHAVAGAAALAPALADDVVDVALAVDSVECAAQPEAVLAGMIRALRPGGALLVSDRPDPARPPWAPVPTAARLRRLLTRAGAEAVAATRGPDGVVVVRGRKRAGRC